jgi:hypothetical protein
MKMNNKIAVTLNSLVQYLSVRNGLSELQSRGFQVNIFIPSDSGTETQIDGISRIVRRDGFQVWNDISEAPNGFSVLLEPYALSNLPSLSGIEFDYRIRYQYGLVSGKPSKAYTPELNLHFDVILCHSQYESEVFSVYAKTHIIKPLRSSEYTLMKADSNRKTLLFTPTFDEFEEVDFSALQTELLSLKENFTLLVKMHEASEYRSEELKFRELLESVADHIFYHKDDIYDLLSIADVVLAGQSGSIYDALYSKVPVCVIAPDEARYEYVIPSLQKQLRESGKLPYASSPSGISSAILSALRQSNEQSMVSEEIFNSKFLDYESFSDVVEFYANQLIEMDTHTILKRHLANGRTSREQELLGSLSWKITKPIRWFGNLFHFYGTK